MVASAAEAVQCVPYARQISGVSLSGDAWQWWSAADGAYERGSQPRQGAIMVFRQTSSMRHGHVAVVSKVVSRREVRIDHANWGSWRGGGKGSIRRDVAVLDVSPRNDWTQVRVWHDPSDTFGARVNPTFGFIYTRGSKQPHHVPEWSSPVQQVALRAPAIVEKAAPAIVEKAASAEKAPPAPMAKPAGGADDLNRQVLAKLKGHGVETAAAAEVPAPTGKGVARALPPPPKPTVTNAKVMLGKQSVRALMQPKPKKGPAKH